MVSAGKEAVIDGRARLRLTRCVDPRRCCGLVDDHVARPLQHEQWAGERRAATTLQRIVVPGARVPALGPVALNIIDIWGVEDFVRDWLTITALLAQG